jgi:hypothetical protein
MTLLSATGWSRAYRGMGMRMQCQGTTMFEGGAVDVLFGWLVSDG